MQAWQVNVATILALVDEYYDQGCLIILHCEVELHSLYVGKQLAFEFERTKSRLVEMQSWSLDAPT